MLNSLTLLRAMNGIHEEDVIMAEKNYFNKRSIQNTRKIVRISLLAAVLISLFAAGAYAGGFLGAKAIVIPEPVKTLNGEVLVSITQPQAIPEEMDSEVRKKVENARAAWAEWRAWRETSPDIPREPAVFKAPAESVSSAWVENGDGSYTMYFFDMAGYQETLNGPEDPPDFAACHPIETRIISAEEMAERESFVTDYVNLSYGDYDFNYDIHNETEAAKLEEIAAKYGLHLRHDRMLLWSKETVEENEAELNAKYGMNNHTDTSDPRFLSNRELCERISEVGCHGALFREIPRGFDKVYYFDEGTFCVSYEQELADRQRVFCYGYNSMYSSLSSGREVVSLITDPESFETRTHAAPDGTELTIMQKDNEAFLYVYLEDSFFAMHIHSENELTESDIDAIADNLNYSNIGQ